MKRRNIFIVLFFVTASALAQQPRQGVYLPVLIEGKDTIPYLVLPEVKVVPKKTFRSRSEEQQYWRMVARVKKVLPYAREAATLLQKYERDVPPGAKRRDRKVYVKMAEDELMNKYGSVIKKMSVNDGRVLIKLIDRETQHVSYDIIHNIKGGVSAVFWQGVARIFGNNLKSKYDPLGEDWQIEQIVRYIDLGVI